jgi:hydrogenase nickel incorporation protein HypA/HybF
MHELAVTRSILDIVVRHAAAHGVAGVAAVDLSIAALSDLEPEWLQRYFDHLSRGTVAEGAVLRVRRSPLTFECDACATWFSAAREELEAARCPGCGGREARVVSGVGYVVESMEACA